MNVLRVVAISLLVLFLLATGSLAFAGSSAGQATQCQPIEDRQLCFSELTISDEYLLTGQQGEFTVTVSNVGDQSATGVVLLRTANSANETNLYRVDEVTLDPGENKTLSRPINATTLGTHGLRLSIVDPSTQQRFDVTEIKTIEVLEEPPKELGGPIDRTEIALGALIVALLVMAGLGYRQVKN